MMKIVALIFSFSILSFTRVTIGSPISQAQVYSVVENREVQLPEQNGRPSVVIFWNTWCGPCKIEMRRLQEAILSGIIPAGQVYAVNVEESHEVVKSYALKSDYMFQFFVLEDRQKTSNIKIEGTPTLYYFDSNRKVYWNTTGLSKESINKAEVLFK